MKALIIIIVFSSGVFGCATNAPSKHNPGGANIDVSSMEPSYDENPYLKKGYMTDISLEDVEFDTRNMSFQEAVDFNNSVGFGAVEMHFSALNDKGIKDNPTINAKWYDKGIHTAQTYTGFDNWSGEFGADLHTRLEYYLIKSANRVLSEKNGRTGYSGVFSHHINKTPLRRGKGRRPPLGDATHLMNGALMWLKDLGLSEAAIDNFAYTCFPISYSKMMEQSGDSKTSRIHRYAGRVYNQFHTENSRLRREMQHPHPTREVEAIKRLMLGSIGTGTVIEKEIKETMALSIMKRQDQCEPLKETILVDGRRLFPQKLPANIENSVEETIYIDEPRFDFSLFRLLFSKNYYGELVRVAENGAFASLRKPDGRSFLMQYDVRKSGLGHGQKEKVGLDDFMGNDSLKVASLASLWLDDSLFVLDYNNFEWVKTFKKRYRNGPGLLDCRRNNNEFNFVRGPYKLRKVYNCSIRVDEQDKLTNSFVRLLSGPGTQGSLYATVDVEGAHFGGEHFTESLRSDYFNETLFNQDKPILISDYIEKKMLRRVPVNTGVSYIQKMKDGKVEGVVHLRGYKIIFDLTAMSNWYQTEMSVIYPVDKPLTKWREIHDKSKRAARREFEEFTMEDEKTTLVKESNKVKATP